MRIHKAVTHKAMFTLAGDKSLVLLVVYNLSSEIEIKLIVKHKLNNSLISVGNWLFDLHVACLASY